MNAVACRYAFCILYLFYKGAPIVLAPRYLEHLTKRGLIPPSDHPESGAAHMEDMFSGMIALIALAVVVPLFFVFTAGCRRFRLRFLPSRRVVIGFAFRALIVFGIYSILASEPSFTFVVGMGRSLPPPTQVWRPCSFFSSAWIRRISKVDGNANLRFHAPENTYHAVD